MDWGRVPADTMVVEIRSITLLNVVQAAADRVETLEGLIEVLGLEAGVEGVDHFCPLRMSFFRPSNVSGVETAAVVVANGRATMKSAGAFKRTPALIFSGGASADYGRLTDLPAEQHGSERSSRNRAGETRRLLHNLTHR